MSGEETETFENMYMPRIRKVFEHLTCFEIKSESQSHGREEVFGLGRTSSEHGSFLAIFVFLSVSHTHRGAHILTQTLVKVRGSVPGARGASVG